MLYGEEHVKRYRETDGEEGYHWQKGTTTLILTTTGRRSGAQRSTPLIFNEHDAHYLVVASKGGADEPPAWYLNMQENPEVEVQIKGERFSARGRDATSEEMPEMWRRMTASWPEYDDYQQRTDREIPVVVLERI